VEQIGRYQILEEVGRGAMGVVYRAQDPAIGRIIAIKTIRLTDLTDPEERQRLRERLFREAQSAGILSHPNIVTIYDIAEEQGQACIFMEFVNGPSLENLLNSHQPTDKQTFLSIFRQTASALDYAHRKGIVHRDIKPANIMIHDDGQAKITDFGVAKIISHQMTQSGSMMGTPNYMSPEQVQGLAVDGRADQFAQAVIAYELLTGEKPFMGDYLPTLLYKIVREEPVPPQRLNPTLGPSIESVLGKGLAKDPDERYATCSEFVAALVDACNATSGWTPLPRGTSQSMPTLAGNPSPVQPARSESRSPFAPPSRPIRDANGPDSERNPLVRSLVWVLVGIGLIGLVLLGAEKFLFNSPPPAAEQAAVTPQEQAPATNKPSPSGEPATQPAAARVPESLPGDADVDAPKAKDTPPPENRQPDATTPQDPSKAPAGRPVQILTDPPGATVSVDGNAALSCQTPCTLSIPIGRHVLNTQSEGYRSYPHILNVPQETDIFLKLTKATGTLTISSNPPGATIQINGEQRPQKTPSTFALSPGDYQVRVSRDGVPLDFTVQIKDGEFQTRNVNFQ
jgi:serine/threonine protein kinase